MRTTPPSARPAASRACGAAPSVSGPAVLGVRRVAGCLPAVSAPDGHGMILIERRVNVQDAKYRVLAGLRTGWWLPVYPAATCCLFQVVVPYCCDQKSRLPLLSTAVMMTRVAGRGDRRVYLCLAPWRGLPAGCSRA